MLVDTLKALTGVTQIKNEAGTGRWGGDIYDIALSILGKPLGSDTIARFVVPRDFSLPAGLSGSVAKTSTVSTGAQVLTILKNGASVGSVNFASGATSGTFTFASAVTFNTGDILTVVNQTTADATFGNAQITLVAALI